VRNHYSSVASKTMKTNLVKLMGLVCVISLASCSGDDFILDMPPVDQTPKDTTTVTPKNDDTWENTTSDWFEMPNVNVIESYKKTNVKTYHVTVPFNASLGNDLYFVINEKGAARPAFNSLQNITEATPSYGAWYANEEGDSIRTKETSQNYKTNRYSRSLTIIAGEASRSLNGKSGEAFVMPIIVTNTYGLSADSTKVERNDSLFMRYNITDSVVINFVDKDARRDDLKPMTVKAKTVVDFFIGMKEKENNETMPEPTFRVDGEILWISDRTASPIYKNYSKKDQGADWFEVSVIKTTKKTYTVVNGVKKDSYDNSQLADATWNSCMYDAGYTNKWVPCMITPNTGGWVYTLQFSDGTYRAMDVAGGQALIDGLKSFKKDNNAEQTPFLTKGVVKRTFTNGDFYTVNGSYPYTVAAE